MGAFFSRVVLGRPEIEDRSVLLECGDVPEHAGVSRHEPMRKEQELERLQYKIKQLEDKDERQQQELGKLQRETKQLEEKNQKQLEELKDQTEKKLLEHQKERDQLATQKGALECENLKLKEKIQELQRRTSASYESRKMNRDIRPGDITHEHISARFQEYYDSKHRSRLRKMNYKSKEERCTLLSSVLQVACKHCNSHVMQQVSKELCMLHRPPSSPRVLDSDHPSLDQIQEKWKDRSAAFGLLLTVAGIDPKQRPELIKDKVLQELLDFNESFRAAHLSNPLEIAQVLESALGIAWEMGTLVPPAVFHEPANYHREWHELVSTSETDVDPETDEYQLTYCRPVMFFGAEGTVGKVGAVKCLPGVVQPLQVPEETNQAQPLPLAHPLPPSVTHNGELTTRQVTHSNSVELKGPQSKQSPTPYQEESSQDTCSNSASARTQPSTHQLVPVQTLSLPAGASNSPSIHTFPLSKNVLPDQCAGFLILAGTSDASKKKVPILREQTYAIAKEEQFDWSSSSFQSKVTNELPKSSEEPLSASKSIEIVEGMGDPETSTTCSSKPPNTSEEKPDSNDQVNNSLRSERSTTQPAAKDFSAIAFEQAPAGNSLEEHEDKSSMAVKDSAILGASRRDPGNEEHWIGNPWHLKMNPQSAGPHGSPPDSEEKPHLLDICPLTTTHSANKASDTPANPGAEPNQMNLNNCLHGQETSASHSTSDTSNSFANESSDASAGDPLQRQQSQDKVYSGAVTSNSLVSSTQGAESPCQQVQEDTTENVHVGTPSPPSS